MKGDFSRQTFDSRKHYSNVLMQQGRVQIDADWNEQSDIQSYRRRIAVGDLVGLCGGPKGTDPQGKALAGFKISADSNALTISQGRYYVDGILCENESDLQIKKSGSTPESGAVSLAYPSNGEYLVYLDIWERHVNALEDSEIREIALGGPDTCTRAQVAWEVRTSQIAQGKECEDFQGWNPVDRPPTGRMKARLNRADTSTGPCEVTGGDYYRLENQLYRVEIHLGSSGGSPTFKWSRDNGSVSAVWAKAQDDGKTLTLKDPSPQQLQGFSGSIWVEVTDEIRERQGKPGVLAQVESRDENVLTLDTTTIKDPDDPNAAKVKINDFSDRPIIRRWDSAGDLGLVGPANQGNWVELEEEIQVYFDGQGSFLAGDYWLVPSRSLLDDVLWPVDGSGGALFQNRHGPQHHYCPLALLVVSGNTVQTTDCRRFFPPVTDITADDVSFDGQVCKMDGVETVQEAIDTLCQRDGGMCTLIALPGPGWETVFDHIPYGKDVQICFKAGEYRYKGDDPISVKNKGPIHIKIIGTGQGTRLIAENSESVLGFIGCESVIVRDIYAESKSAGKTGKRKHLNGVLTFIDTPYVTVENTTLKCRAGSQRMASCLTVRNTESALKTRARHADVRVRHNNFLIGHLQTGILLIDTARVHVEDNSLSVVKRPGWLTAERMLKDPKMRAAVHSALFSHLRIVELHNPAPNPGSGFHTASFHLGGYSVEYNADDSHAGELATALMKHIPKPESINTKKELSNQLHRAVNDFLLHPEKVEAYPGLKKWIVKIKKYNPSVASQGIVVGGRRADDVRILNNTIHGVLQGIHVGQSRSLSERKKNVIDRTERLQIINNSITLVLPLVIPYDRHGIFCGNCNSLVIENNYINIKRTKDTKNIDIDGIRVYGRVGRFVKVCQNHIIKPSIGIFFNPQNSPLPKKSRCLWIIGENLFFVPAGVDPICIGDRPRSFWRILSDPSRVEREEKIKKRMLIYGNRPPDKD